MEVGVAFGSDSDEAGERDPMGRASLQMVRVAY
jgi:hypothetical protein